MEEKAKILIVEDERIVAEDIRMCLKKSGYAVADVVASGNAALKKTKALRPDLVLMDIVLQGKMNGVETAERIRTDFDIPIIYLTAYADERTLGRAKLTEPYGYILKPFEDRELQSTIEMALYKHGMEEKVKESEKKFRALVEQSLEGIVIIQDFRVVFANAALAEITGYSVDGLLSLSPGELKKLVHPDDRKMVWGRFKDRLEGKEVPSRYGFRFIRRDNSVRWVEMSASVVEYGGRPAGQATFVELTERKRTEEALLVRNLQYKGFVENNLLGIWRVDFSRPISATLIPKQIANRILDTGYFGECNDALAEMYGLDSKEQLVGKPIKALMVDLSASVDRLAKMVKNGFRAEMVDTEEKDSQGKIRYFRNSYFGQVEDGKLLWLWGIQLDITERRKVEEALRESETKYSALVENSKDGIVIVQDGVIKFVNRASLELVGYLPEELVGGAFLEVIAPDDREKAAKRYTDRMSGKEVPRIYEMGLVKKDGSVLPVEINASLIDYEGRPADLVIVRDVTERRHAEETRRRATEALQESENRLKAIFEASRDGIVAEKNDVLVFCNMAYARLFGYANPEELLGKSIFVFIAPEDRQRVAGYGGRRRRGEQVPDFYEFRGVKKDGTLFDAEASVSQYVKNDERFIVAAVRDITERKRVEEERERIRAQLLQAQKMEAIGILAGGIAHDFNNLLTAIQGCTDMAMLTVEEEHPSYRDLKEVRSAAGRAANLTRQLLLFSSKHPMEPVTLSFNRIVEDLLKMLHRLIGEDIVVETALADDLWTVNADRGTMEQVVMNLAVNARDAMPTGGSLHILTENAVLDEVYCRSVPEARPGRFVRISVVDTGAGMDGQTLEHIFEPFFSTKGPGRGTGLGLSVVYGIVKQHDGWIEVKSEIGKGTFFAIYLPAVSGSAVDEGEKGCGVGDLRGRGERVLLVEDDEGLRDVCERALKRHGYEVLSASSAWEALDVFEREGRRFDLVFSDVVLPDRSGVELVDEFLSRNAGLHILLSSGYTGERSQWHLIQERGHRFLQKPYTLPDLLRHVKEAIASDEASNE